MELTIEQLVLLGLVASLIAQTIKWLSATFGVKLQSWVISLVVVLVSVVFSRLWAPQQFPAPGEDIMLFINQLLTFIGAVVGFATLIYNFLLKAVLDKVGLGVDQILHQRLIK